MGDTECYQIKDIYFQSRIYFKVGQVLYKI